MTKKILSALLCVMMSAMLSAAVSFPAAAAPSRDETVLSASVLSNAVDIDGGAFRVAIDLSLGDGTDGMAVYVVTVCWDTSLLELTDNGWSFKDTYGEGWDMVTDASTFVNTQELANGKITVSSAGMNNRAKSEGTLFLLEFRPKAVGEATVTVVPGSKNVTPENALASADGLISPVSPEQTLRIRITNADWKLGDADGNGRLERADCEKIRHHAVGAWFLTGENRARADLDGDGRIDGTDYLLLCRELRR